CVREGYPGDFDVW
nr:immunoglobulin heavy chain junction region [Mus musculus]